MCVYNYLYIYICVCVIMCVYIQGTRSLGLTFGADADDAL